MASPGPAGQPSSGTAEDVSCGWNRCTDYRLISAAGRACLVSRMRREAVHSTSTTAQLRNNSIQLFVGDLVRVHIDRDR